MRARFRGSMQALVSMQAWFGAPVLQAWSILRSRLQLCLAALTVALADKCAHTSKISFGGLPAEESYSFAWPDLRSLWMIEAGSDVQQKKW